MGHNTVRLITHHWDSLIFVPKAKSFLGTPFGTGGGFTKGDPKSPMIFNIVVDTVVRAMLEVVCGTQEARYGIGGATGEQNPILYTDDGRIAGRDHIWLLDSLTVTVEMLRRVGLDTNLEKTKALVCNPGYIWREWSE